MLRFNLLALVLAPVVAVLPVYAGAETVRFGWCTTSKGISMAPLAAAIKFGWLESEGIDLDLVNVATGNDCAKFVATGEVQVAAPSIEPTATMIARGGDLRTFFTIQQVSSWGIEAPADRNIQTVADLKGKKIGVISLSAVGASIVKGLAKNAGLDPDTDISLVAVGDAQRAAYFLQRGEIDAVSIFTLAHLQIAAMGIDLQPVKTPELDGVPSIGLVTTPKFLQEHRDTAVGLARAYAKGLVYTFTAPEAAQAALYEVFPDAKPADAVADGVNASNLALTQYHAQAPSPLNGNLPMWGYSNPEIYDGYLDNLFKWGLVTKQLSAADVIDNDLLKEANDFDAAAIQATAQQK